MGRALLVDCDGGWRRAVPCVWYAGFNTPFDVCDIIIRGQSACIRDHFSVVFFFLLSVFVHLDRYGHKRSREDGVARSDVRLTFYDYGEREGHPSCCQKSRVGAYSSFLSSSNHTNSSLPSMSLSTSTQSSTPSLQFSDLAQQTESHSCDTLPPARPSSPSFTISEDQWSSPSPSPPHPSLDLPSTILSQPTSRKLCIRHQRIADEGTNLKLQQVRVVPPPFPSRIASTLLPYYVSRTPLYMPNIYNFSLHPS